MLKGKIFTIIIDSFSSIGKLYTIFKSLSLVI